MFVPVCPSLERCLLVARSLYPHLLFSYRVLSGGGLSIKHSLVKSVFRISSQLNQIKPESAVGDQSHDVVGQSELGSSRLTVENAPGNRIQRQEYIVKVYSEAFRTALVLKEKENFLLQIHSSRIARKSSYRLARIALRTL
jgi:hypothetical protein